MGVEKIAWWFSWPLLLTIHYLGNQIKKNGMCGQVNTCTWFWWGILKERDHFIFEFPCITSLQYIINQQDATLAVLCLLTTTSMLYMFRTLFASTIRSTINCTAATGVCHELGWNKSCIDVQGWCALYYSMAKMRLLLMMDAKSVRNM